MRTGEHDSHLTLRLDGTKLKQLRQLAERQERSTSDLLRCAVDVLLDEGSFAEEEPTDNPFVAAHRRREAARA